MADRDVDIYVSIVNNAKKQLKELEKDFKRFQAQVARISSDVDVDDGGDIAWTNRRLNHMARDRTVNIRVNPGWNKDAIRNYSRLFGSGDMVDPDSLNAPKPTNFGARPSATRFAPPDFSERMMRRARFSGVYKAQLRVGKRLRRASNFMANHFGAGTAAMGSAVRFLIPTWHQLVAVIAAAIPALIALGVAALGTAAAFGALAIAGGAMVGLGLLGFGDSLEESMAVAQRKLGQFKRDLFTVAQPTASLFAPFADRFLATTPGALIPFLRSLEGLRAFEDDVIDGLSGISEWAAAAIDGMVAFQPIISQLVDRFGPVVGNAIIDFFEFLLTEASENQEMLLQLGATLGHVLRAIYNFALAFSKVLVVLSPVFDLLAALTEILNNRFVLGIVLALGAMYAVPAAIGAITTALASLNAALTLTNLLSGGMFAVLGRLAVGAGVFGLTMGAADSFMGDTGTIPRSTSPGSASGTTYDLDIIVQGDVSRRTLRDMRTEMGHAIEEHETTRNNMAGN